MTGDPAAEPVHVPLSKVTLHLLKSHQSILRALLGRSTGRAEEDPESQRLYGTRKGFKSRHQCFADLLSWLWADVVAPIYHVLKSVSIATILFLPINICGSYSTISIVVGYGGYPLVHLQASLYMPVLQLINLSNKLS